MPPTRRRPGPIDVRSAPLRKENFPQLDDIVVLQFTQDDKCYDYMGNDANGNKIYKQVTCPWDTITIFDPELPGG